MAVAAKISTLRAEVNVAKAAAKQAVKAIITPIRRNVLLTKYRTSTARIGRIEERVVAAIVLIFAKEAS